MLKKLALYVCPVPGCATIGKKPESGCPKHPQRALKREVYEHAGPPPTPAPDPVSDLFRAFGRK